MDAQIRLLIAEKENLIPPNKMEPFFVLRHSYKYLIKLVHYNGTMCHERIR